MGKNCQICAYCLKAESAAVLRCGYEYFQRPPSERKPARLDQYPAVQADDRCPNWADQATSVLRSVYGH